MTPVPSMPPERRASVPRQDRNANENNGTQKADDQAMHDTSRIQEQEQQSIRLVTEPDHSEPDDDVLGRDEALARSLQAAEDARVVAERAARLRRPRRAVVDAAGKNDGGTGTSTAAEDSNRSRISRTTAEELAHGDKDLLCSSAAANDGRDNNYNDDDDDDMWHYLEKGDPKLSPEDERWLSSKIPLDETDKLAEAEEEGARFDSGVVDVAASSEAAASQNKSQRGHKRKRSGGGGRKSPAATLYTREEVLSILPAEYVNKFQTCVWVNWNRRLERSNSFGRGGGGGSNRNLLGGGSAEGGGTNPSSSSAAEYYAPALILSPYDVDGRVHNLYMNMFASYAKSENKVDFPLKTLVYFYECGLNEIGHAFALVDPAAIIPYEVGVDRGYDQVNSKCTTAKLTKAQERFLRGVARIRLDASLPRDERGGEVFFPELRGR